MNMVIQSLNLLKLQCPIQRSVCCTQKVQTIVIGCIREFIHEFRLLMDSLRSEVQSDNVRETVILQVPKNPGKSHKFYVA